MQRTYLRFCAMQMGCLLCLAHIIELQAAEATFNVEVPSKQWKAVRLKNIPRGATVKVSLKTSGTIIAMFMDSASYRKLPKIVNPLFRGELEKKLSFTIKIEKTDHYYMVLSNRSRSLSRQVEVTFNATQGTAQDDTQQTLIKFEYALYNYMIFKPFSIKMEFCNKAQPPHGSDALVLCVEYVQKLHGLLRDKNKMGGMSMFALLHNAGHIILSQWQHPGFDDERVADEFATALIVMLGQKDRTKNAMKMLVSQAPDIQGIDTMIRAKWHMPTAYRMREIIQLLDDVKFVKSWQAVFVPHMQTRQLSRLLETPQPWIDIELIKRELASRDSHDKPEDNSDKGTAHQI